MPSKNGRVRKTAKLSADELVELKMRQAVLQQVQMHLQMVQESYRQWTIAVRDKYGLTERYQVNLQTGKLTPREEEVDGG